MDQIRHRDKQMRWYRRIAVVVLLCVMGVLSLTVPPLRAFFSRSIYMVAPSVWEWGDGVGKEWDAFFALWHDKNVLETENKKLQADISRMEALVLDRNALEQRAALLEEMLGRHTANVRTVANVIFRPGRALYDILVIDRGEDEGVMVGDQIVYSGVGAIGEVAEVYPSSAKVLLYSTPGEKHDVIIGREHPVWGTAVGRGMGNFEVKIPQGSSLALGDQVVLPQGVVRQSEVVLGVVGDIEVNPVEPFTRVLFRTSFNINDVHLVEVVAPRKK